MGSLMGGEFNGLEQVLDTDDGDGHTQCECT